MGPTPTPFRNRELYMDLVDDPLRVDPGENGLGENMRERRDSTVFP